jgi:hypothetical protein
MRFGKNLKGGGGEAVARNEGIPEGEIVKTLSIVGFEVLTAAVMKSTKFWDITPCSPLKVSWLIFRP